MRAVHVLSGLFQRPTWRNIVRGHGWHVRAVSTGPRVRGRRRAFVAVRMRPGVPQHRFNVNCVCIDSGDVRSVWRRLPLRGGRGGSRSVHLCCGICERVARHDGVRWKRRRLCPLPSPRIHVHWGRSAERTLHVRPGLLL